MDGIEKLLEVMAALRNRESGCPWDAAQTHLSLTRYTVEEAYEVVDAIRRGNPDSLCDELGDLLLQVVFHARIAEENGAFDFDTVAQGIADKMHRRHPHVFGSEEERQRGAVAGSWERIKASERASLNAGSDESLLDGVALALPALMRAETLGKRAARGGFDWPNAAGPADKIAEELDELREALERGDRAGAAEELGDLLFAAANFARHLDIDAEEALADANRKFERRFRQLEAELRGRGSSLADLDLEALEKHWQSVKRRQAR